MKKNEETFLMTEKVLGNGKEISPKLFEELAKTFNAQQGAGVVVYYDPEEWPENYAQVSYYYYWSRSVTFFVPASLFLIKNKSKRTRKVMRAIKQGYKMQIWEFKNSPMFFLQS